ncbi:MAG: hypothetical protein NT141_03095 [candidate division WWE3 bacterium]|nr:hypothetical protein [candidate division WWE3 bacterium]
MLKKLIFVSGWVFLALPTIFNFFKIAGFNFRFYDSYLTGSGYNTYSGLINGLYLTGCFVLTTAAQPKEKSSFISTPT